MRMPFCRSCKAEITWLETARGKKMPVDGDVPIVLFDITTHVSHWDTCPDAQDWKGKASPKPAVVEPKPLNLNFGEQDPELAAVWAARAALHKTPLAIVERIARVRTAARMLLRREIATAERLSAICHEITGLSRFEYLTVCSQQTLERLAERFEGMRAQ